MHKSFWYIDIGNSSLSIVQESKGRFHQFHEFNEKQIPKLVHKIAESGKSIDKYVIICSVVPKNEKKVFERLKHYKTIECKRIGQEIQVRIRSKYLNYRQLGNDRKVNVFGALKRWKPPFLILDFGTATTVDYVSKDGVFQGGMILPGIKSCLNLLHEKTALLPPVRIKAVPYFLGKSTKAGMLSGVLHGYGAMVRGLMLEFKSRYGRHLKTIGTGGLVDIVGKYCGGFDYRDPMLTLRGIRDAYREAQDKE